MTKKWSFTEEQRQYDAERIAFSTDGTGKAGYSNEKKKSVKMMTRQLKISRGSESKQNEEWLTYSKKPVGYHQADQHSHYKKRVSKETEGEESHKEAERIFEEKMAKNFISLRKYMNPHI